MISSKVRVSIYDMANTSSHSLTSFFLLMAARVSTHTANTFKILKELKFWVSYFSIEYDMNLRSRMVLV